MAWRGVAVALVVTGSATFYLPVAGGLENVPFATACASTFREGSDCVGPPRNELDVDAEQVLALLETDAACILLAGPSTPSWGTCALPAMLSFDVFAVGAGLQVSCKDPNPGSASQCDVAEALATIRLVHRRFRSSVATAAAGLEAPQEIVSSIRRFMLEDAESIDRTLSQFLTRKAEQRWRGRPLELSGAVLASCHDLGLARRVLFWRANTLFSVMEFGLSRYLSLVAPRADFLHSRLEVLIELLGGPPAQGRQLVEVGVHLARLSFALLANLHGLRFIGVDPFVYDGQNTPAESAARQLQDLGLSPEADGALALQNEVREAAEAKLSYFADRARLITLPSVEAAARVPDHSVDGVFIDGDHSYAQVVRDIDAWEPKVQLGGFISGHDFGNHPDVARAVLERAAARNRTVFLSMDWVWYWYV